MFSWLKRRADRNASDASAPSKTSVYGIGDIHGRFDLLMDLLGRIAEDKSAHPEDEEAVIVCLGDYVDRGLDSKRVVEFLQAGGPQDFRKVHLKGNHEEAMLAFMDGESDGSDWLQFGGLETLYSYGVQLKAVPASGPAVAELRDALHQAVPPRHVDFMRSCKLTHIEGDYLFVHAGVRPGILLEKQESSDLLWMREDSRSSQTRFEGKVVVHGHTICNEPQNGPHRINVDTGAFASGRLTAVVLRGTSRRFLTTGRDATIKVTR